MSSPVQLYDITIPVYIRQLTNLHVILTKAHKWVQESGHPETFLTEASLAPDMKPLHFQIQVSTIAIRSGVFGPDWRFYNPNEEPEYEKDFPGMLQRVQTTIDWLKTLKPGYEGAAEGEQYKYWPPGMSEGNGEPIVFGTASRLLNQYVLPNFYFHMTTAYDICRHKGVPLEKMDFLLGAGPFN